MMTVLINDEPVQVSTATSVDLRDVLALRDELAQWLTDRGIGQWHRGELPEGVIEEEVAHGSVHIVRCTGELVAAVTIAWADPLIWGARSEPAGYIHRLMVDRRWAGRGIGLSLLCWAEMHTRKSDRRLARLDCVRSNRRLRDYYQACGYRLVGYQDFSEIPWAHESSLYEKPLGGSK